jgi:hypothetical protein
MIRVFSLCGRKTFGIMRPADISTAENRRQYPGLPGFHPPARKPDKKDGPARCCHIDLAMPNWSSNRTMEGM